MSFDAIPFHGFPTTVLTQEKGAEPKQGKAPSSYKTNRSNGLFLISNHAIAPLSKINKSDSQHKFIRRNRKTITRDKQITFNDTKYNINVKNSGIYVEILTRMVEQLEVAFELWNRVLVVRFDLHMHTYVSDSKPVSNFVKRISTKLKRAYGFKKIGYCWVREQKKAKAQHYHFVLYLEGRRVKHPKLVLEIIREAWVSARIGHHVPHVPNPFYFGTREEISEKTIYRISYLAKVSGKGLRPSQNKDFQCSRMKLS